MDAARRRPRRRQGGAPPRPWRPTAADLAAATGRTVEDVAGDRLRVLFVGINPGLYTAAIGHHFGRPGNRFWPLLARAGFTPTELSPFEEAVLPSLGIGITNLVPRATANAAEVGAGELRAGARALEDKVRRWRPGTVAFLGMGAYRVAFGRPAAAVGPQPERLGGAAVWVLPNPSGLQATYQMPELVALFTALREAVDG